MNRTIHKFVIPVQESFMMPGNHDRMITAKVEMPAGAEVLSVENQRETLTVWANVDIDAATTVQREFVLLATGAVLDKVSAKELHNRFAFLNTVLFSGGSFVLHVFYRV